TVESLIKAGAFDSFGHPRRGLLEVHAEGIDAYLQDKRAQAIGQDSLFGELTEAEGGGPLGPAVPAAEWDKSQLLAFEREMLGLYVSDHPLFGLEHVLAKGADCSVAALTQDERADGAGVTVGGIISGIQRKVTKQGNPWAIVTLEDLEGVIDVMFFPATYQLYSTQLIEDAVVFVKGRLDKREDAPKIVASELGLPDLAQDSGGPVVITMATARCTPPVVERLKEVLATHPGLTEVHLQLRSRSRTTVMRLDDGLRVTPSPALMGDLKALLGPACLAV
ncbi:MAG: OB-fold nucleic acid binding domain-containing protein, partial [Streptomycetales bacterium]